MLNIGWMKLLVGPVTVMALCSVLSCASEPPPPTRSNQEIKTDSDRMFEKMKQEERERAKDAGATTR